MRFLIRTVVTALAVALAAWLIPGINLTGDDQTSKIITLLIVAVIIGVVNAVVKPVVKFLSGCLVILTLGLFLLVINALMLMLVSWLSGQFGLGFSVDGFWPALFGSIIISVVSGLLASPFKQDGRRESRP